MILFIGNRGELSLVRIGNNNKAILMYCNNVIIQPNVLALHYWQPWAHSLEREKEIVRGCRRNNAEN